MNEQAGFSKWLTKQGWAILLIAAVQFGLHLWTNAHDSIFRDEMYYLVAAQHPAPGYLEFPPFIALVAGISRSILGDSVFALRLLPAIAGVIIVFLTAAMAATIGGSAATQVLAALAAALAPAVLAISGLMTMDPFDQLWWSATALLVMRMIRDQRPRAWIGIGVVIGLGLQTKLTIAFYVLALLFGLLLGPGRQLLFNRWLVLGGLIALVIISPYLFWQASEGFPLVEYTANYSIGKTYQATPPEFLLQQIITMNPLAFPLWLAGLGFLLFVRAGRPFRAFGWAYILLFVLFMVQKAKYYWLSPAYPALFAAGAVALQQLSGGRPQLGWLRPTYTVALAASALLMVPLALPILSPEDYIKWNAILGGMGGVKQESLTASELPQGFADRYGWEEMVSAVGAAYDSLTPEERSQACILTENYGEAAAMDYYGAQRSLPRAISGHNSYYLWGPQGCTGEVVISVARPLQDLEDNFESVTPGPTWSCKYCMPYENGTWIYIGRGLKMPIEDAWPSVKDWN